MCVLSVNYMTSLFGGREAVTQEEGQAGQRSRSSHTSLFSRRGDPRGKAGWVTVVVVAVSSWSGVRVPWGLSLTPEVFPHVLLVIELGRGCPSPLALQLQLGHLTDSCSHCCDPRSVSLGGSLQFTTFSQ